MLFVVGNVVVNIVKLLSPHVGSGMFGIMNAQHSIRSVHICANTY